LALQDALAPVTNDGGTMFYLPLWNGVYDIWIETIYAATSVITTNNGSNYWTIQFRRQASTTNVGSSFTTAADTAGTNTRHTVTVGALSGTTDNYLDAIGTKTNSPGDIYVMARVNYRLVGT
jgi:hypothetical protein